MSEIVRITENASDIRFSALHLPVSELLDAIAAQLPKCPDCDGEPALQVPCDTPLQWDVAICHNDGCGVPERVGDHVDRALRLILGQGPS